MDGAREDESKRDGADQRGEFGGCDHLGNEMEEEGDSRHTDCQSRALLVSRFEGVLLCRSEGGKGYQSLG